MSAAASSDDVGTERPNIVFILVDDLGWSDLSCYGSTYYETPVIDSLARDGMLFTDAYAAAPVCSPTRASILTGQYPARVGVTQYIGTHTVGRLRDVPSFQNLPLSELSLARALREGGYQTWHVGKWHLGDRRSWPDRHGFDVNIAGNERGMPSTYWSPYGMTSLSDGPDGEYLTDRLTDEAIRLIEGAGHRPFLLNLWHYAVHTPIEAPPQLIDKYREKARALGLDAVEPFAIGEVMPAWHQRKQRIRRRTVQSDPAYAAMIENLDRNIGRLLTALDACGMADNTLLILTSDNGGESSTAGSPTCNAPLAEGKGWMYDGGIRVPLIVRWPGVVAAGSRAHEPVTSPDFYPTLLDAASLARQPTQHVDGASFLPTLRGSPQTRGPIYWHYPHYPNQGATPCAAIRDGVHKLVRFFEDDHSELYRLDSDPSERRELSSDEPETARRLRSMLDDWLDRVGARTPTRSVHGAFDDLPG